MSAELAALAATAFVHLAAVLWSQRQLTADLGVEGNLGTREGADARLSPMAKRLRRALANHTENIGPFIIAVILVELTGAGSGITAFCAWAFVLCRTLYLPAYAFGWVPWRSLIYTVGMIATFTMILASFF